MQPEHAERYPLAPLQRGMLFHALAAPESTAYVEQHRLDLEGDLDPAAFRAAWQAVCERHPALRTAFDARQAQRPLQVVQPALRPPMAVEDWRHLDPPALAERLRRHEEAQRRRGFDPSRAPLFRLSLLRLGDRRWRLVWTHHHLILDGWSVGIVLRDVADAYEAALRGELPASLPPPPRYRDFVALAARQDPAPAEEHWTGVLAGFTEPTPLGIDRGTARGSGTDGGPRERLGHRLTAELTARLGKFAAGHLVTLETLLAGAWAVVLGRYAGAGDVVFGVTSPGRSGRLPGLDRMVGVLINTLPARVRLDPDRPVAAWLRGIQRDRDRARELEHTPLDRVQAWSEVPAGRRLFDSILVVEDFPFDISRFGRLGDLLITESVSVQETNFPLTLLAFPRERLVIEALFDGAQLEPRLVRRLPGHLEAVLDGLTSASLLGEVDPVLPAERAELIRLGGPASLVSGNRCPGTDYHSRDPVGARFAGWARREPDRIAVSSGADRVSYGALLERVARLANRLRGLGVGPGVLVGLHLPRGVDLVVAVLAVSSAGGGYVPVDRRDPPARVRAILGDASVAVLLTDRDAAGVEPWGDGPPAVVCLDDPEEQQRLAAQPAALPPLRAGAGDVAYVIYTSGSTGAPKGVVVEHAQLARLFTATQDWFEFGPEDVWTLFHSIAFDFSVWELWGALATGGRLVVVPDELTRDPAAFRQLLLDEGVTVLNQTPSAFRTLLHADLEATAARSPFRLRLAILGGEQLEVSSLRPWLDRYGDRQPRIVNMYGITETTVHVTYRPIGRGDLDGGVPSPIGVPIPDLAVRLADQRGRLVPFGVPGEIHVGGAGVARGYLRRPELTAERFAGAPDDPGEGTERWYRTGDRARWLPDGGLEFLGRVDDQVKIRGHRIEPGEVEGVLNGHPLVRESVVVARGAAGGHRQLVAYVVAAPGGAGLSWSRLRGWLAGRLPEHLVPAGMVTLDRLPLTVNGKVDRAALAAIRPDRPDQAGPVAPRTEIEQTLAQVWAEVLGLERLGVTDNFFANGGDSILAIQAVSRAARRGVAITPAELFKHQTIAELARVAAVATGAPVEAEQGEVTGEVPATPITAWFHRLALPHAGQWNLPVMLLAHRPVRVDWLAGALAALVAHHDMLRLRVTVDGRGRTVQRIIPVGEHGPVPVQEHDLTGSAAEFGVRAGGLSCEAQAALDLARGPLLSAALFRTPRGEPDRLLLVAHHLVVDAVSWLILLEDLDTAYRQLAAGAPVRLPRKTTDFPRWARSLAELARSERVAEQANWWLTRPPPQVPALPIDGDRDAPNTEGGSRVATAVLDEPTTARLLAPAHRAYRTRPDELLLAALAMAMAQWTGQPRLLVDVEGHGRDLVAGIPGGGSAGGGTLDGGTLDGSGVDVSRTVGWFTTLTPVWLDLAGIDPADAAPVIKTVKEQLRAMPGRGGAYGLARWLRDDDLAHRLAAAPRAQISFNYLGRLDQNAPQEAGFALADGMLDGANHPANPRPYLIDVVAGVRDGRLHLYLTHSTRHHSLAAMDRLAAGYLGALRAIADHCMSPGAGSATPSDFPLAQLDQAQLDRLVEERGPIEDLYPLAPLQRGLLFHTLASPSSGVYFEQFSIRLDGDIDTGAFERAWEALLQRHAVLRAGIAWRGLAIPHLAVLEQVALPLERHDWCDLAAAQQASRLDELLAQDRVRGFDLTRAPLTRVYLIRLAPRRWRLAWSHHHILLDGWSVALLIQEIFDNYEAILGGHFVESPPPRPYRDYIAYLANLDLAGAWSHWRRVLSGVTGPTPLGADRSAVRAGRRDADYARLHRRLPPDRSDAVREFAREHRLTLDTVLHGVWALVLAHRSGLDDVVFGVTSAGRPASLPGIEEMVGLFISTLPARVRVSRDQPVVSWLAGLLRDQVRAREFEHTPLDQLRSWTSVPPDQPLFDSGRGLENYPMDGSRFRTGSVTVSEIETFEQANYGLSFVVVPDEALFLQLLYDALRFTPETADHVLRTAEALTLALVADPDRTVGEVLDLVPARDDRRGEPPIRDAAAQPAVEIDTGRIANRMRELPMVRDAVATPAPDGQRIAVYLVPDVAALDRDDGAAGPLAASHVEQWRALYDRTYAGAAPADPTFNTVGWNSSYTGDPIAEDAMAEWRAHTLDRLRALRPARVLEIGCGTGLLLFGLLDGCDRYVGTDFSPVCLAQLRDQLAALDAPARAKVTLLERTADDLAGVDAGSFDVVVLNSVVQYFPGPAYLGRVLEAALAAAAPGGAVFLGDLRHHGLLAAFHVSVQLHRAADLLPIDELHARVSRSLENERELLVDPAYLTEFAAAHPEVGAVELLPKRGVRDTELTRYRYDAVLRLGGQRPGSPQPGPAAATTYDWSRDVLSRSEIEWLLDNAGSDSVEVTGVPNARVAADAEAARLLTHPGGPQAAGIGTAGDLRLAAGKAAAGMDPEELYRLGEGRGWSVAVSWATRHAGGSINALFRRGPDSATAGDLHAAGPEPDLFDVDAGAGGPLTNTPLRTAVAGELERHARQALRQDLPEYAGACQVVVLDELPRTADGRVDEAALPAVEGIRDVTAQAASGRIPPRTAGELRLARIWERALRVRAVDVRTSFFDLGGDSLLAIRVVDEATRVFGRDVPLAVLLQEPTIEGMAAALRTAPGPWTPLVEITPGAGTPFFCVHPAGGSVLCYAELARSIDTAPLYALQARGLDRDEPPYGDLSAMAARYLQDVRATQPSGPYLLGGWSFGGLVAYEMAQQLADAGEGVGLLALIDTPTPDLVEHVPDEAAILARTLDGAVTLDPDQLRAMPAADRLRHVLTEAERARAIPPGMDPELARQLFGVFSANLEAAQRYRPRRYAGRTCLLRAAQSELTAGENRWAGLLTGPWELIEVPGNHETILWPPNVQQLASALQSQFAAALIAWRSRP